MELAYTSSKAAERGLLQVSGEGCTLTHESGEAITFGPGRAARRRRTRLSLIASDGLALYAAMLAATYLRFGALDALVAFEDATVYLTFWQLGLIVAPLWMVFLASEGLYDPQRLSWGSGELSRVARSLSLGVVGFIVLTYVLKLAGLSRAWTLLAWLFAVVFVIGGRAVLRIWSARQHMRGKSLRPTLIVGSNAEAADIIRVLGGSRAEGLRAIGCLASSQAERLSLDFCAPEVPCLGTARELAQVVEEHDIDTVIIASSAFDHDVLARMIAEVRELDLDVNISSGLFEVLTSRVSVREVSGVPLITVHGLVMSRTNRVIKRIFDVTLAAAIILVGLPVWLVIITLIRLTSPGPTFYVQERIGRDGKTFGMYKFRSMVADADARLSQLASANEASGPLFKMKDDPRVTAVGKWMRKFSVDEFPQLINVLKGEMSLVGPRPPLPREVTSYTQYDWRRLEVVPGMTGLWQVSGRSSLTFEEMVRLDLFYIENWSVTLDLALLARTVPAVLFARGAY